MTNRLSLSTISARSASLARALASRVLPPPPPDFGGANLLGAAS